MSKRRKPMTADEKKSTMLSLLYASGEVYSMKELVKLGASAGVVENTVEDVCRGLLAERLILDDKIGSGCFFWSFPSTAFLTTKARVAALETALTAEEAAAAAAAAREAAAGADAPAAAARAAKLAQLEALRSRRSALEAEVRAAADVDPAVAAELLGKAKKAKAAADRWTDNLLSVKAHLIKKCGMGAKEAAGMLGIGADFDYPA